MMVGKFGVQDFFGKVSFDQKLGMRWDEIIHQRIWGLFLLLALGMRRMRGKIN